MKVTHELRDGDRLVFRLIQRGPGRFAVLHGDHPRDWDGHGPEWALREFIDWHARHVHEGVDRVEFGKAIQDGAWALASWATGANWVALDT
jgi:hypothetical protein